MIKKPASFCILALTTSVLLGVLFIIQKRSLSNQFVDYKRANNLPLAIPLMLDKHPHLYNQYIITRTVLDKELIPHWAIAGTALGVARNGAIIPWDDDIDIGIRSDDEFRAERVLKAAGLEVERTWWGIKVNKCVDLFCIDPQSGAYHYALARKRWPAEMFDPLEVLGPVKEVKFGPTTIPVTAGIKKYLARWAGSNWETSGFIKEPHAMKTFWKFIWFLNPLVTKHITISSSSK